MNLAFHFLATTALTILALDQCYLPHPLLNPPGSNLLGYHDAAIHRILRCLEVMRPSASSSSFPSHRI